ncbi:hypothetical protein A9C11_10750 [Pseudomonas citronellolis]|uniref:Uncharacterized protein n=1 Tax=Pseudomonas citronellolis TaxID=53408 RepID=A0A1A9KA64_9PSED|nr:hypothetical protein [Pseudomonas citronellolis]ANI14432.1 hypothetical protein A9C11_10750 [Pseudomonas citronellolis]
MTDIREEFETYWKADEQEELRKSCAKGWAERIWQASRAALKVELPDNSARAGSDPYQDGYYACREEVEEALQQAGIEVKQQ